MADQAHQAHHHTPADRGTMDLTDHMKTWLGFWAATKWSAIGLIVVAILLAIFRTN
jgi:hypothetical protein